MENLDEIWREYRADNVGPGTIVIDIGASELYFTDWAVSMGAEVHSFDARHGTAVGPYDGFCTVKGEGLGAYIVPGDGVTPMVSLASILAKYERVDFLKCDIEGGEYLLDWDIPTVERFAMEFHAWTTLDKPVEGVAFRDEPMPPGVFDTLVWQLQRTHTLTIVGPPEAGGYIFGLRHCVCGCGAEHEPHCEHGCTIYEPMKTGLISCK